ncbi:MAG: YicC/YloC family endoribonuclease [Candidatus Acidiferrales bacterium]
MPGTKTKSVPANLSMDSASRLKSMTGYAQARAVERGWSLRVTVRSVNHRFLDLHLRVPEGFEPIEPRIRQIVREHVRRGHLDINVQHDLVGSAAVGVNMDAAAAYVQAVNSLRKQFGIQADPDLASILRLPGVVGAPASSLEEELERFEAVVSLCLTEALDKLDRMRAEEADVLREEMSGRLSRIASISARVEGLVEISRPAFAQRLERRLKELLGDAQIDPARLAHEAALAAERSDVSEELVRLKSHVRQFQSLLEGSSDVGKKLDFLLQEMQREANTLLSKTPGNETEGLEITQLALEIKSEIEKLREQVQNIE